tara:strand:+ start:952 stop:1575 length:624 start_codon:yes stop_codon:yes gene_type:complete
MIFMHIKIMKSKSAFLTLSYFLLLFIFVSCNSIQESKKIEDIKLTILDTNKGKITIKLYADKAPETVKNFLYYAENGHYEGTIFHRVIKGFMIQGGGHLPDMSPINPITPVVNESNNNLSNKKGTVAMARTNDPHSATSQFFINLATNEFLDKKNAQDNFGYCVFGEVIEGMEVVESIGEVATKNKSGQSDVPVENVIINKIQVIDQ